MNDYPELPASANHALLIGNVFGALMACLNYEVKPVLIGGDYSDTIRIKRPSGWYQIKITPEEEE
jgi:hypothetical protein